MTKDHDTAVRDSDAGNSGLPFDIAADWLSFSLPHAYGGGVQGAKANDVHGGMSSRWPELKVTDELREVSRAPYNAVYKLAIGGQVLFSELVPHVLIEIQGAGCRALENSGDFYAIATRALSQSINITRFDIAVDFEADTDPEIFIKCRGKRWKATSVMISETGKTAYVGAPKSARRARVYRYAPPHERAHLIRVEMVAKKPRAVGAVEAYLHSGPTDYAAMCGAAFGWYHPLWCFTSEEKIAAWTPERGSASTLMWIRKAVIPSLSRLHETGVLPAEHTIWRLLAEVTPLEMPELSEQTPPLLIGGLKSFNPPVSNHPLPGLDQ